MEENKKDIKYKIHKFYEILKQSPLDAYVYSANNDLGLEHVAGLTDFKNKINNGEYGEAIGLKRAFELKKEEILPIVANRYIKEKIGTEDLMALGLSHNELYAYLKLPTKVPEEIYKYNEKTLNFLVSASNFTYENALYVKSLLANEDVEGVKSFLDSKKVKLGHVMDSYDIVNKAIVKVFLSLENEIENRTYGDKNRLTEIERKILCLKEMLE